MAFSIVGKYRLILTSNVGKLWSKLTWYIWTKLVQTCFMRNKNQETVITSRRVRVCIFYKFNSRAVMDKHITSWLMISHTSNHSIWKTSTKFAHSRYQFYTWNNNHAHSLLECQFQIICVSRKRNILRGMFLSWIKISWLHYLRSILVLLYRLVGFAGCVVLLTGSSMTR